MNKKIMIMGATGVVGTEMIKDIEFMLCDYQIELILYASERSAGKVIIFNNKEIVVNVYNESVELEKCDVVFMSAGSEFSKKYARIIQAQTSAFVIDNSSAWRMDPDVPLVVPSVNINDVNPSTKLIANPNCSTIQMVIPLKILQDKFGLSSVHVSTYQSVSGAGQSAIDDLSAEIIHSSQNLDSRNLSKQSTQKSFNVIPAIDRLDQEFHCFEEIKMIKETQKILNNHNLDVFATTARVPVFHCHCEALTIKINQEVTLQQLHKLFKEHEIVHLNLSNSYEGFDTPRSWLGRRDISISRLRLPFESAVSSNIQMWIVADNLKIGASTNAVGIYQAILEGK